MVVYNGQYCLEDLIYKLQQWQCVIFGTAPHKGHIDQLKCIYAYLKKLSSAAIHIRVNEPDYNEIPAQDFDWCNSVNGKVEEVLPRDAPKTLRNTVTTTTCKSI